MEIVNKIIEVYSLPIKVQLMSEIFKDDSVHELIQKVQNIVSDSVEIQHMLQKTVLQNRIHQENKMVYRYAAEAIATALLFDLKIGPPRERFYDEAATEIAQKLKRDCYTALYLTPAYPLGLDFMYFLLHPEIEEYGLTPYKAGSNKLENNRIILGSTPLEHLYELIDTSFLPKKEGLPDPVGDLKHVCNLAGYFLGNNVRDFNKGSDSKQVKKFYAEYIHVQMKEVFI